MTSKFMDNPFVIKWKAKLDKLRRIAVMEEDQGECNHMCTSNCRKVGCNCLCGEFHCGKCFGKGYIVKDEWTGTDTSYEVEVRCRECREED